ncbi:MAG: helix-turn-helix domain-containing protein [Melioribacteraceae bacterium]|nr:helix-turn-helix domain-containing protein [Melioribacteraceae bacterium]MCF8353975.1 helix-turn-helix domain-containing protein [Melioribacteraceae bacterium]MCF8393703.1 helix-turn-helix domain-containing protein [Melioribacteraceae bacterium]MCF8419555.1 helix-turn-helix domain-containing protein [Melioribacteraceae bacterium]
MNKFEIGNEIKQRRKFLKITQQELSEIVGVGLRSLIDIESGKGNPTIDQLQKVLSVLGLTFEIKVKSNE